MGALVALPLEGEGWAGVTSDITPTKKRKLTTLRFVANVFYPPLKGEVFHRAQWNHSLQSKDIIHYSVFTFFIAGGFKSRLHSMPRERRAFPRAWDSAARTASASSRVVSPSSSGASSAAWPCFASRRISCAVEDGSNRTGGAPRRRFALQHLRSSSTPKRWK